MKKINYLILLVVVVFVGISCEPTYEKQYSWAYPLAGDWTVRAYYEGEDQTGPYEIKVYNSSFGQDSVWIDDYATTSSNGNWWSTKFKVAVDMTSKTFQSTGSINAVPKYGIVIKVTNGKVIGNDSITMDVVFEDDPTSTYQIAGHRTTSYEEYMAND